jgi:hypothetical protein
VPNQTDLKSALRRGREGLEYVRNHALDGFSYDSSADTTKTIQDERRSLVAAFLAIARIICAPDVFLRLRLIRGSDRSNLYGIPNTKIEISDFSNHCERSGTQNAVSADVREPDDRGHRSASIVVAEASAIYTNSVAVR